MKQIQTIAVEHIKISSERSFEEVRRRLEATLPKLDASIAETLRRGDQKRAAEYEKSGPKLSIFEERDHGSLLETFGGRRKALQYEIGNPLTASKMTRYQLSTRRSGLFCLRTSKARAFLNMISRLLSLGSMAMSE
jgi:hypothetical protein